MKLVCFILFNQATCRFELNACIEIYIRRVNKPNSAILIFFHIFNIETIGIVFK